MIEEVPLNFEFNPKISKLNYPQCRIIVDVENVLNFIGIYYQ